MESLIKNHLLPIVILSLVSSCASYEPRALDPMEVLHQVEATRAEPVAPSSGNLTFVEAAEFLLSRSPKLAALEAEHAVAASVSGIPTPWPNPSLEAGPDIGSHLEPGASRRVTPFVALGFAIPWGGRLGGEDDLNEAKTRRSLIEWQSERRRIYLEFRSLFTRLALAERTLGEYGSLREMSEGVARTVRAMAQTGALWNIDAGIFELEAARFELECLDLETEVQGLRSALANLLGLDASTLPHLAMESLPSLQPSVTCDEAALTPILLDQRAALARLRADYEVAEKALRLEVAKQYPDIQIGGSRSRDTGEEKVVWGLRLGIELPIFDRNQQGIARAKAEREALRSKYLSETHEAISELSLSLHKLRQASKRRDLLVDTLMPKAKSNVEEARAALETGGVDILKYLEAQRTRLDYAKEVLAAEREVRMSWSHLEEILNHPIVLFPGETTPVSDSAAEQGDSHE
ncbi:MAG: TolC family protein [Planctomycetota bacterium]